MSDEPDNLILRMLREMRAEMAGMREVMATKGDLAELRAEMRSDMHSLRAEVASDLADLRAEVKSDIKAARADLGDQIAGLRQQVIQYHSSVIGHGVLIGDLEARVRRVERHLDLPAMESH